MTSESDLIPRIKSRGYRSVIVRPGRYKEDRFPMSQLPGILSRTSVRLRGWDFPHLRPENEWDRYQGQLRQSSDWRQFLEHWRFSTSGQFAYLGCIYEDWGSSQGPMQMREYDPSTRPELQYLSNLYRFMEVFEFAARLAAVEGFGESITFRLNYRGIHGRTLSSDRLFLPNLSPSTDEWDWDKTMPVDGLVERRWRAALEPAESFFSLFGLDVTSGHLDSAAASLGLVD